MAAMAKQTGDGIAAMTRHMEVLATASAEQTDGIAQLRSAREGGVSVRLPSTDVSPSMLGVGNAPHVTAATSSELHQVRCR